MGMRHVTHLQMKADSSCDATGYLISGSADLPAVFPRVMWPTLPIWLNDGGAVE